MPRFLSPLKQFMKSPGGLSRNGRPMQVKPMPVALIILMALVMSTAMLPHRVHGRSADLFLHRQAQEAKNPIRDHSPAEIQDEIDREIEKYFNSLKNAGRILAPEIRTGKTNGRHTFKNRGRTAKAKVKSRAAAGGLIRSHRVKRGDTIYAIAKKYGISPKLLLRQNPMLRQRPLYIGEEILLDAIQRSRANVRSRARHYIVRRGDSLSRIGRRFRLKVKILMKMNRLKNSIIRPNQRLIVGWKKKTIIPRGYTLRPIFVKPVQGRITSGFGRRRNPFVASYRSFHKGLDYGANLGSVFFAARSGVVVAAQRMGGYGNCIFIRHAGGYVTVYAHAKKMLVRKGEVVKQKQRIGYVGRTGNATGPHLHFEIRRKKRAINPLSAFKMTEIIPKKAQLSLRIIPTTR